MKFFFKIFRKFLDRERKVKVLYPKNPKNKEKELLKIAARNFEQKKRIFFQIDHVYPNR